MNGSQNRDRFVFLGIGISNTVGCAEIRTERINYYTLIDLAMRMGGSRKMFEAGK